MQRTFTRTNGSEDPRDWDRFMIRTRWNSKARGTTVYVINAEAGKEVEATSSLFGLNASDDYHTFITELTEELLDEGWREE